ncbi:MAG: hypothetical protein CMF59_11605 [Leptospiraceae bacterium]|nr:hypothetical protein [Leptospiraceae bacterium]
MKKLVAILSVLSVGLSALAGCSVRYLKDAEEQGHNTATLCIDEGIKSNEIDGEYYVWSPLDLKMVLPAGKHEFLLRYHDGVRQSSGETLLSVDAKPGEIIFLCNTGGWDSFRPVFTRNIKDCGEVYRPVGSANYEWMSDSRKQELQPCLSPEYLDKEFYKIN